MTSIGNKIIKNIKRPSKELVEKFRNLPVANIGDTMGRLAAIDSEISRINRGYLLGVAFTVRVPIGDNLMFHKAMDLAQPGDVIMIDAGGDKERAIVGELMASYCAKRGIAGIVVDGSIRDEDVLQSLEMPIYAKGCTPNGPYKNGPGEINVPISIGGKVVKPGDIIVGDGDGIIAIDPEQATQVLGDAKKIFEMENEILKDILEKGIYPRPWIDKKLEDMRTIIEN